MMMLCTHDIVKLQSAASRCCHCGSRFFMFVRANQSCLVWMRTLRLIIVKSEPFRGCRLKDMRMAEIAIMLESLDSVMLTGAQTWHLPAAAVHIAVQQPDKHNNHYNHYYTHACQFLFFQFTQTLVTVHHICWQYILVMEGPATYISGYHTSISHYRNIESEGLAHVR